MTRRLKLSPDVARLNPDLPAAVSVAAPNKYHARRVTVDGVTYDSQREAEVIGGLRLRERAGEICCLSIHPRYPLYVGDDLICYYVADAEYHDRATGKTVVVDVKAPVTKTQAYRIKAKLFAALYRLKVTEVA